MYKIAIALAVIVVVVIATVVLNLTMNKRESFHNSQDTYNKLQENKEVYAKNNKIVEKFFNQSKNFSSTHTAAEIVNLDQKERRALAMPMTYNKGSQI